MIRLDLSGKAAEPERLEFPEFATGKGKDRVIPAMVLMRPTTATERAAWAVARTACPGRDEDESEEAHVERVRLALQAYGADALVGRLDLKSVVSGAVQAIALASHVKALIVSWEHFGDGEGQIVEPTETAIEAALREPRIADRVQVWMASQLDRLKSEGNG